MPRGHKGEAKVNGSGRKKGTPNKITIEFKQALNNLLEFAAPQMVGWLEQIAREDPNKAMDHVAKLAEYVHPKLARTDGKIETTLIGDSNRPVAISLKRSLSPAALKMIEEELLDNAQEVD